MGSITGCELGLQGRLKGHGGTRPRSLCGTPVLSARGPELWGALEELVTLVTSGGSESAEAGRKVERGQQRESQHAPPPSLAGSQATEEICFWSSCSPSGSPMRGWRFLSSRWYLAMREA